MTNILFLSFGSVCAIRHCKITAKFDNNGKGKAKLAIRLLVEISEGHSGNLDLYMLIKNDEKRLKLEKIDQEYNKQFDFLEFRNRAGIGERLQEMII